ncbi:nicotinate-nucleotide adenylyltransferase [soil metagenome]
MTPTKPTRKRRPGREKLRIGLSMGTFNPIHLWHMQVAQCAWDQFDLDFVYFIPNGDPPHKSDVAPKKIRYRCVQEACRGIKHFRPSRIEVDREGKSYTVDTLRALQALHPDAEFFLIIVLDNVEPINRWMEADEIFKLTQLLVAPRDAAIADREIIAGVLPKGARFGIIDCPGGGISSTIIRNWIKTGRARSADYLFPNVRVRNIVVRHRLYR